MKRRAGKQMLKRRSRDIKKLLVSMTVLKSEGMKLVIG